ncbi:dGTP triphosphohydrolase [Ferrovibrio sp.]|uniref:dGTP triphosphohydrolase n=1 Tax=Ferrovibrio sp. TaxID=1917215 RepID=UPI001B792C31|nr:dNTP triphosphohydrolase [Ferrovibrio sp.]MBP7065084.1 dNTP triphosphohydrolase [Ferrovibrio sp.]
MNWIETLDSCPPRRNVPNDGRSAFQQDADRIVFSSAFRRLQNKTQVHPLPHTDFVRTRLTHSMEVASVGRSLGGQVARRLLELGQTERRHIAADLGDIVAAACLAHDIGNPPFGHTGEQAMQQWFAEHADMAFGDDLTDAEQADFLRFEGNAQGFRILTRLQMDRNEGGMRLMDATLGAFTKYPSGAAAAQGRAASYVGRKKHGFMQAEAALFAELAARLKLAPQPDAAQAWQRHPLAYLVEAADDICYSVIDVEDGVKLGRIGFSEAEELFKPIIGADLGSRYLARSADEKLSTLRSRTIGSLIDACCAAFVAQAPEKSLADVTPHGEQVRKLKNLAMARVYRWERTVTKELEGIAVIQRLLDLFVGALNARAGHVTAERLLDLVPHYDRAAPRYQRLLAVTDYISGMTDRYAMDMQQQLREIKI